MTLCVLGPDGVEVGSKTASLKRFAGWKEDYGFGKWHPSPGKPTLLTWIAKGIGTYEKVRSEENSARLHVGVKFVVCSRGRAGLTRRTGAWSIHFQLLLLEMAS